MEYELTSQWCKPWGCRSNQYRTPSALLSASSLRTPCWHLSISLQGRRYRLSRIRSQTKAHSSIQEASHDFHLVKKCHHCRPLEALKFPFRGSQYAQFALLTHSLDPVYLKPVRSWSYQFLSSDFQQQRVCLWARLCPVASSLKLIAPSWLQNWSHSDVLVRFLSQSLWPKLQ